MNREAAPCVLMMCAGVRVLREQCEEGGIFFHNPEFIVITEKRVLWSFDEQGVVRASVL